MDAEHTRHQCTDSTVRCTTVVLVACIQDCRGNGSPRERGEEGQKLGMQSPADATPVAVEWLLGKIVIEEITNAAEVVAEGVAAG